MLGYVRENRINVRNVDWLLVLCTLVLSIFGVFVVHSATAGETTSSLVSVTGKQLIGVVAGLIVMAILTLIDYHMLVKYSWVLYAIALVGLIYVKWFAPAIYGAHRWIYFPFLGTIQPSEFAKPALIVFLALIVYRRQMKEDISKIKSLLIFFTAAAPVVVLTLIEPDLSTTIVMGLIVLSILFIAGINYKWIVGALIVLVPLILFFIFMVYQDGQPILNAVFREHQVLRINAYFFPEDYPAQVYQQNFSVMAIGSGGFWGKGLNNASLDSVKNGNFLSEESCDFVFAVIGEEAGFFGCMLILLGYSLIVVECFRIAFRCKDTVGKVIAGACGASIGFQSLINIGVSTLLIPNTGIPLPFLSAGMSSLLSTFILIGLALSVGMYGRLQRRVLFR